jgi:hypothetical protein
VSSDFDDAPNDPCHGDFVKGSRKALAFYVLDNGLDVEEFTDHLGLDIQTPCAIVDVIPTMKETYQPSTLSFLDPDAAKRLDDYTVGKIPTASLSWSKRWYTLGLILVGVLPAMRGAQPVFRRNARSCSMQLRN